MGSLGPKFENDSLFFRFASLFTVYETFRALRCLQIVKETLITVPILKFVITSVLNITVQRFHITVQRFLLAFYCGFSGTFKNSK